ncbi:hypothetical protein GCM10010486_17730 [Nonomuraea roseoviolacea subsp. carminata]
MALPGCDLDALRSTFPGWSFFRSDAGALYATRRGTSLCRAEIDAGLEQTVSADDYVTLVALLRAQQVRQ